MSPAQQIPGTEIVIFTNPHTGDFQVNLAEFPQLDDSIKNEDIVNIGTFEDYNSSGTTGPTEVMLQGVANELAFDLHAVANKDSFDNVTNRGARAATHRQRPRIITMEVENGC